MDELAAEHGFSYEVAKADIDEKAIRHPDPQTLVLRLAHAKAAAVIAKLEAAGGGGSGLLVTCDQVVLHEGRILEKPEDAEEVRGAFLCLSLAPLPRRECSLRPLSHASLAFSFQRPDTLPQLTSVCCTPTFLSGGSHTSISLCVAGSAVHPGVRAVPCLHGRLSGLHRPGHRAGGGGRGHRRGEGVEELLHCPHAGATTRQATALLWGNALGWAPAVAGLAAERQRPAAPPTPPRRSTSRRYRRRRQRR